MDRFAVTGHDRPVFPAGNGDFAEKNPAILETDQIRLAVQPGIIRCRPRRWNKSLSVADFTDWLAPSFADRAVDLPTPAALLALADICCPPILHHDDFPHVPLAPHLIPSTIAIRKFLPQLIRVMAG